MARGEFLKVEHGRVLLDGPTPRRIVNQGPNLLLVTPYTGGDTVSVQVDEEIRVDVAISASSLGRSRIVVYPIDSVAERLADLERKVAGSDG